MLSQNLLLEQQHSQNPLNTFMAMQGPDNAFKRVVTQAAAKIITEMQQILMVINTLQQKTQQLELEREAMLSKEFATKLKQQPPQVIERYEELMKELDLLSKEYQDAVDKYLNLQVKLHTLQQAHPNIWQHTQLRQQKMQQAQSDLQAAVSNIAPKLNITPQKQQQIVSQLQDSVTTKATVLETQARYLASVQEHTGEEPAQDQRQSLQIAYKLDLLQELKLRFGLTKAFKEIIIEQWCKENPGKTPTPEVYARASKEAKGYVDGFFKQHLSKGVISGRAEAASDLIKEDLRSGSLAKATETFRQTQSTAFITTIVDEMEGLSDEISASAQTIAGIAERYAYAERQLAGFKAQVDVAPVNKDDLTSVFGQRNAPVPKPGRGGSNSAPAA